ncbi:MAG: hypothetical protein U9Q85_03745 [Patescibacteria group bacterium]|nr:hypothetical protein [Patescibacteria group bacterium]
MVDLLNNKKTKASSEMNSEKTQVDSGQIALDEQNDKKNKANIGKYQDLEGLSIFKLEFGFWFLKHRIFFLYMFYGFLILISVLTWPWFIWTFGNYIFVDMKADEAIMNKFANNNAAQILAAMQAQRPRDLEWQSPKTIKIDEGTYSFVVKIFNPNPDHMAEFSYSFSSGDEKSDVWENFIYPAESKYIILLGAETGRGNRLPVLNIKNVNWSRISKHDYPDWQDFLSNHFNVVVSDKEFIGSNRSLISNKEKFFQIKFQAENKTAYSYKDIVFTILLKQGESIVGVERWTAKRFISGEKYAYNLSVLGSHNNVNDLEIYPEINVTDQENYLYISSGPAEKK